MNASMKWYPASPSSPRRRTFSWAPPPLSPRKGGVSRQRCATLECDDMERQPFICLDETEASLTTSPSAPLWQSPHHSAESRSRPRLPQSLLDALNVASHRSITVDKEDQELRSPSPRARQRPRIPQSLMDKFHGSSCSLLVDREGVSPSPRARQRPRLPQSIMDKLNVASNRSLPLDHEHQEQEDLITSHIPRLLDDRRCLSETKGKHPNSSMALIDLLKHMRDEIMVFLSLALKQWWWGIPTLIMLFCVPATLLVFPMIWILKFCRKLVMLFHYPLPAEMKSRTHWLMDYWHTFAIEHQRRFYLTAAAISMEYQDRYVRKRNQRARQEYQRQLR